MIRRGFCMPGGLLAFCAAGLFVAAPVMAQPSFTLTVTPSLLQVDEGGIITCTVTVQPLGGFQRSVTLGAVSLP